MEITINSTKEVPLLSRKEVSATVLFSGATPSRLETIQAVADKLSAKKELIVQSEVKTTFGVSQMDIVFHVYDDADVMKRVEGEHMIKRIPAEKKVESKVEEAPAEEKKEGDN